MRHLSYNVALNLESTALKFLKYGCLKYASECEVQNLFLEQGYYLTKFLIVLSLFVITKT